jgi:hypothetical protein
MTIALQPIYTQTVGSGGAASVTFNNIPQFFTDLKLVTSSRMGTASGNYGVRFNADATNSYSWTYVTGNGASASSGRLGSASLTELVVGQINGNETTADSFASSDIYIPNYTLANFKQVISDGARPNNGSVGVMILDASMWLKTAAITSLTIRPYAGNGTFVQFSTFTLYGITKG